MFSGRLGFAKRINKESFRTVLTRLWRPLGMMSFREVLDQLWIFEFFDLADKEKMLRGRPWSFDRILLVLNDFTGNTPPSQIAFTHSSFWVQVHNMPLICMTRGVGQKIGATLGEIQDVDVAGDGVGWGRSLRLRVSLDVTKPLDRGRALFLEGKSFWVSFKYEKLPTFCFHCVGIIHGQQGCLRPRATRSESQEIGQWGAWLRAEYPKLAVGEPRRG